MRHGHLKNSVFAEWALDPGHELAVKHFEACSECRREAVDFRRAVAGLRDGLRRAAENREVRWTPPALAEARESSARSAFRQMLPRLIPAALLLVILLAVTLPKHAPKPAPPASNTAADNALMIEIQQDLNRQAPQALAPAEALFADASAAQNSEKNATMDGRTQ